MRIDPANPVPPQVFRRVGPDQVPDHVPPELVRSAQIAYGQEFLAAPHTYMADLHGTMPPIWYDVGPFGNGWALIDRKSVV